MPAKLPPGEAKRRAYVRKLAGAKTPKGREGDRKRGKKYRLSHPEENKARVVTWNKAHPLNTAAATSRSRWKRVAGVVVSTLPLPPEVCCCGRLGKLTFDHCHMRKRFRGWLCGKCNTALGMVDDSPAILRALIEYLGTAA